MNTEMKLSILLLFLCERIILNNYRIYGVEKTMTKAWKILLIIIAVIALLIGGSWLWLSYGGSTRDIETAANQLKSDDTWTLTAEHIEPPRNVCIGDNACPSVFKSWKVNHVITSDEFRDILSQSGWNFPVEGMCDIATGGNGAGTTICSAQGRTDEYVVNLSINGAADHPNESTVVLSLEMK